MALMTIAASAQQKFAHVNYQQLIYLTSDYVEAMKQMNASQQEANETYQSMADEFNTKYSQYQQKASTWTAAIRESKEKELTEIQQRIQEFEQSVQNELQQQQQQLMAPIYQKAQEAVNTIAKAGKYIYVIDQTSVLYLDPAQSVDITPEARKALNIPEGRTLESLQAELQAQAEAAEAAAAPAK